MQKSRTHTARNVLFAAVFVFMIMVGHTAYWLHNTIYDTERFTAISTEAIRQESSRQSIGTAIVDRALANRPLVRQTAGPRLSQMIAGLLGTDLATSATSKLVERSHLLVTTPQREPITFDTTTLKTQIVRLQTAAGTDEESRRIDVSQIPDEITLVDTSSIPNVYRYGILALWVGVFSIFGVIGASIWYVLRGKGKARFVRAEQVLGLVMLSSLIALLVGPLTRPVFLTAARDAPAQTLLGNIFDGFIAPFNSQAIFVGVVASALLALTVLVASGRITLSGIAEKLPAQKPQKSPAKPARKVTKAKKGSSK